MKSSSLPLAGPRPSERPSRSTIVIFSKIPMAPAFGGNRQRIRTLVDELLIDHDVHFALIPSRQTRDLDIEAHRRIVGTDNFHRIARSRIATLRFNLKALSKRIQSRLGKKTLSDNVDYLFDTSLRGECRRIIAETKPDAVIVEYVHFSSIFELLPDGVLKILDTHDSFSNEFTPAAEGRGLNRADVILAIQDREASKFRDLLADAEKPARVAVVSHVVGTKAPVDLSACQGATFLGSNFEANNVSLAALVANVVPLVLAIRPEFKLHVIGDVGTSIPDYPFVIKHGRVADLSSAMALAPILANYITDGTGIKIKLLDAMAMGVPCVSTPFGAEGLTEEFAGGVSITRNDAHFAAELVTLLDDRARRERLGQAGLDAIARWDAEQRQSLKDAIGSPREP